MSLGVLGPPWEQSSRPKVEYKTTYKTLHTSPQVSPDVRSLKETRTFPYDSIPSRQIIPEKAVLDFKITEYQNPLRDGGRPDYQLMTRDVMDDYWARTRGSYLPQEVIVPTSLQNGRIVVEQQTVKDIQRTGRYNPLNPNYPRLLDGRGVQDKDEEESHQSVKKYKNCTKSYPSEYDQQRIQQSKDEYKKNLPSGGIELNSMNAWKQGLIGDIKVKKSSVINSSGDRDRTITAGLDGKGLSLKEEYALMEDLRKNEIYQDQDHQDVQKQDSNRSISAYTPHRRIQYIYDTNDCSLSFAQKMRIKDGIGVRGLFGGVRINNNNKGNNKQQFNSNTMKERRVIITEQDTLNNKNKETEYANKYEILQKQKQEQQQNNDNITHINDDQQQQQEEDPNQTKRKQGFRSQMFRSQSQNEQKRLQFLNSNQKLNIKPAWVQQQELSNNEQPSYILTTKDIQSTCVTGPNAKWVTSQQLAPVGPAVCSAYPDEDQGLNNGVFIIAQDDGFWNQNIPTKKLSKYRKEIQQRAPPVPIGGRLGLVIGNIDDKENEQQDWRQQQQQQIEQEQQEQQQQEELNNDNKPTNASYHPPDKSIWNKYKSNMALYYKDQYKNSKQQSQGAVSTSQSDYKWPKRNGQPQINSSSPQKNEQDDNNKDVQRAKTAQQFLWNESDKPNRFTTTQQLAHPSPDQFKKITQMGCTIQRGADVFDPQSQLVRSLDQSINKSQDQKEDTNNKDTNMSSADIKQKDITNTQDQSYSSNPQLYYKPYTKQLPPVIDLFNYPSDWDPNIFECGGSENKKFIGSPFRRKLTKEEEDQIRNKIEQEEEKKKQIKLEQRRQSANKDPKDRLSFFTDKDYQQKYQDTMQQCIQRPQYDFQPLRTGQQLRKMEVIGSGTMNDQRIKSLIEGGGGIDAWQKSNTAQQSTRQSPFAVLEPFNTIAQLQQQQQQKEQQAPTYQQYNPPSSANASISTSSIQQHTDTTSIHNKPIYQTTQLNPPPFSTSSLDNLPINAYDPTEDGAIRSVENTLSPLDPQYPSLDQIENTQLHPFAKPKVSLPRIPPFARHTPFYRKSAVTSMQGEYDVDIIKREGIKFPWTY